jgi:hypothetical protein
MTLRPRLFDSLSPQDKLGYIELRQQFSDSYSRKSRNGAPHPFVRMFECIKSFVVRGNEDDMKRGFVCGICWVGERIAVNTRHLSVLTGHSKSSMGPFLTNLGFVMAAETSWARKVAWFPHLKGNQNELRQWHVRERAVRPPQPEIPKDDVLPLRDVNWEEAFAFLESPTESRKWGGDEGEEAPEAAATESQQSFFAPGEED